MSQTKTEGPKLGGGRRRSGRAERRGEGGGAALPQDGKNRKGLGCGKKDLHGEGRKQGEGGLRIHTTWKYLHEMEALMRGKMGSLSARQKKKQKEANSKIWEVIEDSR